jgi:hypothetical protein
MGQVACARRVFRIEKLAAAAIRIFLAIEIVLPVFRRQKRRLVVVEPPRNPRRGGVLEVHNRVLVACEFVLVKQRACAMHQAMVFITGPGRDALPVKARKQRGRAGAVKTSVVIEDTYPQDLPSLVRYKVERSELLSIKGSAARVKAKGHTNQTSPYQKGALPEKMLPLKLIKRRHNSRL